MEEHTIAQEVNAIHVIRDPGENKPEIEKFKFYDVIGLINSKVIKIPYPRTRRSLIRVGVLTPSFSQIVLDVWNNQEKMEPHFFDDWKTEKQLALFKNIQYVGEICLKEMKLYHFRITQDTPSLRYIWLSAEKFWENPIIPDDKNHKVGIAKKWPICVRPYTIGSLSDDGALRKSCGSKFGRHYFYPKKNVDLHSLDIFQTAMKTYQWDDIYNFEEKFSKIVNDAPKGFGLKKKYNRTCLDFERYKYKFPE